MLGSSSSSMHIPSILFPADSNQGMSRTKSFGTFRREFELDDVCGYIQSGVQVLYHSGHGYGVCTILLFMGGRRY